MREGLTIIAEPGVCLGCSCTDLRACLDPVMDEPCYWVNDEETWCSVCALLYWRWITQPIERFDAPGQQPFLITEAA